MQHVIFRSFPSFHPRFASKCDCQFSDLTQDFTNPYNELKSKLKLFYDFL